MSEPSSSVVLSQSRDYQFVTHFGEPTPDLLVDEPAPLGASAGPSPVQLLATAIGNCLSSSLLFALRKFKQSPDPIECTVVPEVGRNAEGRMRVLAIGVTLRLGVPAATLQHLDRVLATFESYCTVTQSVKAAIPVTLQVFDSTGVQLK